MSSNTMDKGMAQSFTGPASASGTVSAGATASEIPPGSDYIVDVYEGDARPPTPAPQSESRTVRPRRYLAALAFGALTLGAVALGAPVSKRRPWYWSLRKSKANPPSWVFGPVWTGLYATIAYSGYRIWAAPSSPERTKALRLWGVQMALNASWTPLFFGAHQPKISAAVATSLVPTVGAYAFQAKRVDKPAALMMLPYLGWSAFAAFLNIQIVRKNR